MAGNPLAEMMKNGQLGQFGNMAEMVQQFNQFKKNFTGDPKQQIQNLLNSGKITQAQYNQAVQLANQYIKMLK